MRRSAAASERPKSMTLEAWAVLDEDVEGELVDGFADYARAGVRYCCGAGFHWEGGIGAGRSFAT